MPWMPETCASATSATGAVARDELAEQLERADADVDARGGEHDVVERRRATASATSR